MNGILRSFPSSTGSSGFIWATGIEDTFIAGRDKTTGRVLDEYLLTEHYDRWEDDIRLMADLGVSTIRYGVPWYRICPRAGSYDWNWTDKVIDTLVNRHHIEPIVDLVHYGTPQWLDRSFLNPDYPALVSDYACAFASHYKGTCSWYTPLNEPRVNAWYCGRLGWWPPYGRSWRWFLRILIQISRGICLTQAAISSIEPRAVFVHVDSGDLYVPQRPDDTAIVNECQFRQELVFLALDFITGKVNEKHALFPWLQKTGLGAKDLEWFSQCSVKPSIIGFNMYPMFSLKEVVRKKNRHLAVRIRKTWVDTLVRMGRMYSARYSPVPIMVAETAYLGSMSRRIKWIEESTQAIFSEMAQGIPYVGYTFWPFLSIVGWAYQKGKLDFDKYLLHMGLYDLVKTETGLERKKTPAAESFKRTVARGLPAMAAQPAEERMRNAVG